MNVNGLARLRWTEVFNNRPPQSIAQFSEDRYEALKAFVHLGFDL